MVCLCTSSDRYRTFTVFSCALRTADIRFRGFWGLRKGEILGEVFESGDLDFILLREWVGTAARLRALESRAELWRTLRTRPPIPDTLG